MSPTTHPPARQERRPLLLLSGGHDSTALAAWQRPAGCLTIDYGQRPVAGEMRASKAVADALGLPWFNVLVDLTPVGSGLMHPSSDQPATPGSAGANPAPGREPESSPESLSEVGAPTDASTHASPSPEWWPYRNQLLVSLAAAWALPRGYTDILVGSVAPDGARHRDGTTGFYKCLDDLVTYQEGNIRVLAPAVSMTTVELIEHSGVTDNVLAFAHSCHIAEYPCGACPGCFKHEEVLVHANRLQ